MIYLFKGKTIENAQMNVDELENHFAEDLNVCIVCKEEKNGHQLLMYYLKNWRKISKHLV